jgi:CheY-like chemotaxis protein
MGIQGNTSLLLLDKGKIHRDYEKLKKIERYVEEGSDLTRQLVGFARSGKYEVKPTDLNELIEKTAGIFGRTRKEISIHTRFQDNLWVVEIDQGQMEQVLLSLFVNAMESMVEGGDITVETENVTLDQDDVAPYQTAPGEYVKVSVTDTGVGMDPETKQRVFDPFFSTREMGRGTGLGLAAAYGIIRSHGGMINVASEKGHGTTFNIHLPASMKEIQPERQVAEKASQGAPGGGETVLLIDDEEMIIDVGKQMLENLGYAVLIARSGQEGLAVYRRNRDRIQAVILDMVMPDMGGGETYDRLKEVNPNIRVLLSSGYSINGQATDLLNRGCNGFVQKPFNLKILSQKVREVIGS